MEWERVFAKSGDKWLKPKAVEDKSRGINQTRRIRTASALSRRDQTE
ncbi:MAG: hypothetical protein ABI310_10435 [Microbacteriaceae bacterium]